MQPLDLVEAAPWRRVVFTTYALSLSFFEAVALERLVRGGGRNTLILADPEGIRAGLSEQGARHVGRAYELEPVACTTGAFHPKLTCLFGDEDAHLLVGSGNLTFGGWGMNLESVEHLHPGFAAEAFDDAADLFESLAVADTIRTGVTDDFEPIAAALRRAARSQPRTGGIRLLHSLAGPIANQLQALAEDLGGATRLTIVSPYFDRNGSAVARLSALLHCEDVRLHAHPVGAVRGTIGTNWPAGTPARPVSVVAPFGGDGRPLHVKCMEILCGNGRLLVSGSANATEAALFAGNIEASLVRIQRATAVTWSAVPASPPVAYPPIEPDETADGPSRPGVLRAVLEGDRLVGQVVVPRLTDEAVLSVATPAGYTDLGTVQLDGEGRFSAHAPDLERQSWASGRVVLRITQKATIAEGFVSVAAAAGIVRRAGALAPRLLAMLSGTETPDDVAAILTWFKEDLDRLKSAVPGTGDGRVPQQEPTWVPVQDLVGSAAQTGGMRAGETDAAWERALQLIRSAFSRPRGPWKAPGEDDDASDDGRNDGDGYDDGHDRRNDDEKARCLSVDALDGLLDDMLDARHRGRHASSAFALAHYLADRLRPAPSVASGWLQRILADAARHAVPLDPAMATSVMLGCATGSHGRQAERARILLLRGGVDPERFEPDMTAVPGWLAVLAPSWDVEAFLALVRRTRTPGEEVRMYLDAAARRESLPDLPILRASPHWRQLDAAFANEQARSRFVVVATAQNSCPRCHIVLPTASRAELAGTGITHHCRIILCTEV